MPVSVIVKDLVKRRAGGVTIERLAGEFHVNLAELFVAAAKNARDKSGINRAGLSGGVYQNRYFSEYLVKRLTEEKFEILRHHQVPTNDGGLALGQIVIADAMLQRND